MFWKQLFQDVGVNCKRKAKKLNARKKSDLKDTMMTQLTVFKAYQMWTIVRQLVIFVL